MRTKIKVLIGFGGVILIVFSLVAANILIPAPTPPKVKTYKGFWEPTFPTILAQTIWWESSHLKQLGVNTLSFGPLYFPKEDGTFQSLPLWNELISSLIQGAHRQGLQVYLVPMFWAPGVKFEASKAKTYLDNFSPIVLEWSEVAERYHAELFSPANEPDFPFDQEVVGEWLHEIVPKIKERYSGMVTTKLANIFDMNFTGYDYVGFDLVHVKDADKVREDVATARKYAQRDGCRGVILAEFGFLAEWTRFEDEGVGEQRQAELINMVFQETWGNVDGYFIVRWSVDGFGVKGRPAEQTVKEWFTK